MNNKIRIHALLGCFFSLLGISSASAGIPNTTAAGILSYEVGQGWVTHFFDEASTNRWFSFGEVGGRSYCIEAVQGSMSPIQLDPNIAVYTDATGVTPLTINSIAQTNDNGGGDPNFIKGARVCFIAPTAIGATTVRSVKINVPVTGGSGDAGNVRVRVVDTTLVGQHCQHHFYGNLSMAYLTTNSSAVTMAASFSFPLQSATKAPYNVDAGKTLLGTTATANPAINYEGACFIAHNAPPGAVAAYGYIYDGSTAAIKRYVEFRSKS